MNNKFKFNSFKSDFEIIIRDAELILLENHDFFNNLAKMIIESSTLSNTFNSSQGRGIKVTFTSSHLKNDHKYKEVTFTLDGILFSLFDINYHINGDKNEITREFNFTIDYLK